MIVQFHVFGMRAEGSAGNAIVFAAVTCMAAVMALAGDPDPGRHACRTALPGHIAGAVSPSSYSGSRTTRLALFLSTAAVLWIYRGRRHALGLGAGGFLRLALAIGVVTFAGAQIIPSRDSGSWSATGSR